MPSFKDVIGRWESVADFANDIGVSERTAAQMRWRNSVPAKYWRAMCDAAVRRGFSEVTPELLTEIAASAAA